MADPTLELHDENGALVAFDDDWVDSQQIEIQASGLAPGNSLESAIESKLAPGGYTAIVAGRDGEIGIGLVEVYKLP